METNLNCLDHKCAFNKSGNCYASNIKIEGFEASITPETYCDTFRDKDSFKLSNYSGETSLTSSKEIYCSANNCNYNLSGECRANYLQINLENASCETFIAK